VNHKAMSDAYKTQEHLGNVMRLWHGTRVGNVLSILAKGMYIPPSSASHCTGRMFGNGVYFSDQSTKSLNYAYGYWDGKGSDNHCFMFLFDVIMGKAYTPSSYHGSLPKSGYDSTFAKAGESGVMNNEMIVYNTAQCKPVYLVEFKG
jgi:poly [ADP-ribose] polymerase